MSIYKKENDIAELNSARNRSGSLHRDDSEIEPVLETQNLDRKNNVLRKPPTSLPMQTQTRNSPQETHLKPKMRTNQFSNQDSLVSVGASNPPKQEPYKPPFPQNRTLRPRTTTPIGVTVLNPAPTIRPVIVSGDSSKQKQETALPAKQPRAKNPKLPPALPELIDLIDDEPEEPKYSQPFKVRHVFFGQFEYEPVQSCPPTLQIVDAPGINQIQFSFGITDDQKEEIPFCNILKYR